MCVTNVNTYFLNSDNIRDNSIGIALMSIASLEQLMQNITQNRSFLFLKFSNQYLIPFYLLNLFRTEQLS